MKNFVGFTLGCLFAFLSSGITPLMAQDAAVNELVITGTVKNKDSRKKLENVNVSVVGNNIGTVTNADGTFSLKVAEAEAFRGLEVSHIGFGVVWCVVGSVVFNKCGGGGKWVRVILGPDPHISL